MYKIVVVAPGNFAPSGGPEALHQLVHMCNIIEPGSSAILYEPEDYLQSSIEPYGKYNCPVISFKDLNKESLIVLPEVWPDLAHKFDNKCALWWLSVDFFGSHGQSDLSRIDMHLSQSFYAKDFVSKELNKKSLMVSDWIDFTPNYSVQKQNKVCVNPAKGMDLIDEFIQKNPSLLVAQIKGMSKTDVIKTMSESKIYIDFGHHPGRDRMPREASLSGCVVFTRRKGAASFYDDVPIGDWFKFEEIEEIQDKIAAVLNDYQKFRKEQQYYFDWCLNNLSVFKQEVANLLNNI
jgi:hypothetical protein